MKRIARMFAYALLVVALVLFAVHCGGGGDDDAGDDDLADDDTADDDTGGFVLTSPAFDDGGEIPAKYTCDNDDPPDGLSPPLEWSSPPEGTVAYAIVVIDPDANDCPHWGLINIPAGVTSLAEGVSPNGELPNMSWETLNYKDSVGYAGPCPPESHGAHHYEFTIYALSSLISKPANDMTLEAALDLVEAVSLGSATLVGTYDR